jgi:thiamine biosynthesis lipoprotein
MEDRAKMQKSQQEMSLVEVSWNSIPNLHRFTHEAMATTFEIIICNNDVNYARQASNAAFSELDRIEQELSRFIENSDISRINNLAAGRSLRIGLDTFDCLSLSVQMYNQTNCAFDVTMGPLVDHWLRKREDTLEPVQEKLDHAFRRTGANLIQLDENEHTVTLLVSPLRIDLGGIGKGYALEQMAELLHEWSIDTALLHGGYSSVLALDSPAEMEGWPLTLSNPSNSKQTLARLSLRRRAVSGSGLLKGPHIIDPRTAQPVDSKRAAWACSDNAAVADALSTAFMIMTPNEIEDYCRLNKNVLAMVIVTEPKTQKDSVLHFGPWDEESVLK